MRVFAARCLDLGLQDIGLRFRGHLPLFLDRGGDYSAAIFHLAQVGQALFEGAGCVSSRLPADFLTVAGDEGHGGAFVEGWTVAMTAQRGRRGSLSDALFDGG